MGKGKKTVQKKLGILQIIYMTIRLWVLILLRIIWADNYTET